VVPTLARCATGLIALVALLVTTAGVIDQPVTGLLYTSS
jgi:hypothetical protein